MFTRGKCNNVFVGDVCAIVVSEGSSGPLVKVSNTRLIFLVAGGYAVACTTRRVFFMKKGLWLPLLSVLAQGRDRRQTVDRTLSRFLLPLE